MPSKSTPISDRQTSGPPKRGSAGLTLLTGLLVFALLTISIAGIPKSLGEVAGWTSRILCLLIAAILVAAHSLRRYYRPLTRSHMKTKIWKLPDEQVDILRRSAGRTSGDQHLEIANAVQAKVFTLATIKPSSLRQRLTERYDQAPGMLVRRVTMDVQVPERVARRQQDHGREGNGHDLRRGEAANGQLDETHSTVLFPVIIPRKGELIDNLRILDAGGASVPTLSYRQYLQLVARVMRTLLVLGYRRLDEDLPAEALAAERLALNEIMRRDSGDEPDKSGVLALYRLVDSPTEPPVNPAAVRLAAQLGERLMSSYAVVAAVSCPPNGRFVISYERSITPEIDLASRHSDALSWAKARLRLLLGARPVELTILLENAWTSQSYHLIVDGEDRVFVGSQESLGLFNYFETHASRIEKNRGEGTESDPPPPPYYRFRRRDGQRYAHFYSRFFPEPLSELEGGNRIPSVRFRFFELPPGSVFRALVASVASALLVWLIGFVISRKSDPGTDVPAFLLVFPAIAAAWLGFDAPTGRLLEGTLAARLSLVATALCSVAASGLFMIFRTDLGYLRWDNPLHVRVLGIDKLSWSILTLLALFNFLGILYVYLGRTWEFAHLASRHDGRQGHPSDPD
jgi:hypothetical protein